tara:strand:- start:4479 stop:6044 length:1566 start_codon:yes stop_codon:yes gene_type:complete
MMLNPTLKLILTLIIAIVCFTKGFCQTETDSSITKNYNFNEVLKGSIFDANDKSSLPYANIILLSKNKGVISNEVGNFAINISNCLETDTLRISYIGYQTQDITIKDLKESSVIHLKEDNLMLNNITLFGNALAPENIVKKVLENKNNNYGVTNSIKQIFLRNRYTNHMNKLNFRCKKSNFSKLDKELIEVLEQEIPKHTISYRDFLGDVYLFKKEDSAALKINPIKIIELEEKSDLTKLGELEKTFKEVFNNINENEYWKIKSGIIGGKVNVDENSVSVGLGSEKEKTDSLTTNNPKDPFRSEKWRITNLARFASFKDEKKWDFLYNTNKYQYELSGVTVANGEEVYIIDFQPGKKGKFIGRMYIAMETFALVRIDYKYDTGKTGIDMQLFGIGYSENKFNASMYFEKKEDQYQLKYCSKTESSNFSFNRNIVLQKKRERFLFDKKLKEIKIGISLIGDHESSIEMLVIEESPINQNQFNNFEEKENNDIIYVEQFNEDLWKGYSIIEPTKQMKDYKKIN